MTTPGPPGIVQGGRRLTQRFLLDRCVILDATRARDATGGTTTDYVARPGDPLPCRWGSVTDREAVIVGATVSGKAPMGLTLSVGTAVAEGARVRNVASGRLVTVVANLTPQSVMATSVRLICREV